jgi:acylphosphatase
MIRRVVRVSGRVQGVGFRYSCADEAKARRVNGWVRNLPNGSVEADLEGETEAVEAMIAWMRSGPRWAHVTGIEVESAEPTGANDFRIR